MSSQTDQNFFRHFVAVLGGVLASMAAGYLIHLILHRFFHIDLFSLTTTHANDKIKLLTGFGIWLFASSLVGGLACITIAGKNEMSHIIISSMVALALYFFISGGGIIKEGDLSSWLILLAIPFGYFTGEWLGSRNRK
ncbi:MAG: hypothetical protein JST10_08555 [Bacteroidetes bacterium]|nr:hypothetical protein [Bacteroidota bacterium]MBS1632609.1 hypothetical protein [Bacteroidota bacterium]